MNKVKILLATYNGEKYISEQLQSILNQENVNVEIVISDDASKDKTLQVINDNFPNLLLKINNPGTGSAAKNFLKMVSELDFDETFEYVAFSDQDDIWLPQKMNQAISALNRENAHLYCSNLIKWNILTGDYILLRKDFAQKKYDFLFEGGSAGCTYVFTRDFAEKFQIFLRNVDTLQWKYFSHDWLTYFFARSRDLKVFIDSKSYIHYRLHESNVHGQLNALSFYAIKERLKLIKGGWYFQQIKGFSELVPDSSTYKRIYTLYSKNYFTRLYVIFRYNFQLIRSRNKMIQFAILSLLPIKNNKD